MHGNVFMQQQKLCNIFQALDIPHFNGFRKSDSQKAHRRRVSKFAVPKNPFCLVLAEKSPSKLVVSLDTALITAASAMLWILAVVIGRIKGNNENYSTRVDLKTVSRGMRKGGGEGKHAHLGIPKRSMSQFIDFWCANTSCDCNRLRLSGGQAERSTKFIIYDFPRSLTVLSLKLFTGLSISTVNMTHFTVTRIRFHQELLRFNARPIASFLFSSLLASITSYLISCVAFRAFRWWRHFFMVAYLAVLSIVDLFYAFSQRFSKPAQHTTYSSQTCQLKQFGGHLTIELAARGTWYSPFWLITFRSLAVRLAENDLQLPAPILATPK